MTGVYLVLRRLRVQDHLGHVSGLVKCRRVAGHCREYRKVLMVFLLVLVRLGLLVFLCRQVCGLLDEVRVCCEVFRQKSDPGDVRGDVLLLQLVAEVGVKKVIVLCIGTKAAEFFGRGR